MQNRVVKTELFGFTKVEMGYWDTNSETQWQRDNSEWIEKNGIENVGVYGVNLKRNTWMYWDYLVAIDCAANGWQMDNCSHGPETYKAFFSGALFALNKKG